MRYNIKRLFREHEMAKAEFDKVKQLYLDAVQYGKEAQGYSSELNRLRHAMSLCRQFMGKEIVQQMREGKGLEMTSILLKEDK